MSRQQKRANDRKQNKTALQKMCLAAGEGVSRAVAFSFALASNAFAAEPKKEEPINLPPVVVQEQNSPYVVPQSSLPKFAVPLQDTLQAVIVVPDKLIQEQGGTTLRDALRNVSGISITASEAGGSQGDGFTLRGFNARNDMFIDGVRDQGSYFRDVFNIQSVEVIKGPSSSYFGRGSTGGIINQVSKMPLSESLYSGVFNGGSGTYFRGTGDFNQPLWENSALRLNFMAQRADIVERNHVEGSRQGIAPSFTYGLGTPTQATVSYFGQHEDNLPDYGLPFLHGKPVRVDRDTWYGLTKSDYEKTFTNIGTGIINHAFNDQISLRNVLRYSHIDRHADPSIPAVTCSNVTCNGPAAIVTGVTRSRPERDTQESILSNQLDLTAKFDTYSFKHILTTGLEVGRETFDQLRWASAGPATTLSDPNNNQLPAAKTVNVKQDTLATGFGIYGADQIRLGEYFDIVGGLRYDYYRAKQDNRLPGGIDFEHTDNLMSYRGGLVFHPRPTQSYYFSYGTSFNPSAEGLVLAANNQALAPEKNEIFEIGAKLELLQGALNLQSALFNIEKTNARTNDPATGVQVLDGKQRSRGFEMSLVGRILPGWNVFASYTYLNATILKSNDTQVVEGVTIPLQGKVPQNIPKYSANFWTTYDFLEKWQIGGGPTYVSSRYANNANINRVPGYIRWDSTVAYNLTEKIQLRFNALNMTNQFFIEAVHPSHSVPGAGRTFIGSVSARF